MKQQAMLVSELLPHYRYGVFKALEVNDSGTEWSFAAGNSDRAKSIPTIERNLLQTTFALQNRHLPKGLLWQSGLLGTVRRRRPDVLVFTGDVSHLSTWAATVLARFQGAKVFFWTIGWHRPERGLKKFTRMCFYSLAHGLMLYGETGKRIGNEMGYPNKRMWVINNALGSSLNAASAKDMDPATLEAFRQKLPSGGTTIGVVVRQNASKRLDLVIRAAAEMDRRGRPVNVLLVGEGPEHQALKSLARELGVALFMPGPAYSQQELDLVYDRLSLTVLPCQAGLAVMQSLERGVPVITDDAPYTQAPESDAVRDGETGARYTAGSVSALADAIETWLGRLEASPATVAQRCKKEIEEGWTPTAQAQLIETVLLRNEEAP
ncbi:Glycosyltransferase involved in cell wall bisynthesis [Pedococcus cremeus]|uniref:Glycosyltransferase involved in cell wall bisynthesis n=1 Tax=Pedococcus cremeus TaxID=587636 RepID=A0A1H9RN92_9MICO|nr:glycosyltransferase [Pedococcus cremeus]SER73379.1 Glycosyltransferase involved in cell wall bisynthesis [Pedococcus cremeus]